eukprot:8363064-Pyramimonas_sp.AAC.1
MNRGASNGAVTTPCGESVGIRDHRTVLGRGSGVARTRTTLSEDNNTQTSNALKKSRRRFFPICGL